MAILSGSDLRFFGVETIGLAAGQAITLADADHVIYKRLEAERTGNNMAGSVNKVILIGNLGRDPEVRTTQRGGKMANISVATSERWKDRDTGEMQERTEWHRVVIFGPVAETAEKYLRKGSKVYIEGQLQTRKWEDSQSGQERYTTEIIVSGPRSVMTMLDSRRDGGGMSDSYDRGDRGGSYESGGRGGGSGGGYGGQRDGGDYGGQQQGGGPQSSGADFDDEIPF